MEHQTTDQIQLNKTITFRFEITPLGSFVADAMNYLQIMTNCSD